MISKLFILPEKELLLWPSLAELGAKEEGISAEHYLRLCVRRVVDYGDRFSHQWDRLDPSTQTESAGRIRTNKAEENEIAGFIRRLGVNDRKIIGMVIANILHTIVPEHVVLLDPFSLDLFGSPSSVGVAGVLPKKQVSLPPWQIASYKRVLDGFERTISSPERVTAVKNLASILRVSKKSQRDVARGYSELTGKTAEENRAFVAFTALLCFMPDLSRLLLP